MQDVVLRSAEPIPEEALPRVEAFLQDATGLIEDHCGRDLYRREGQALNLYPSDSATLPIPARYTTGLLVAAVTVDGQEVTDWTMRRGHLVRDAGWGQQLVTVTASWGYETPPASLVGIVCAEVLRWIGQTIGAESEKVGEVEIRFADASTGLSLSAATRLALRPYKRMRAGTLTLRRDTPVLDLRGPHVLRH
ncbi:phage gp6-like head-tail connector protein [Streptomyces sp. CFMR 7]|uniref:phage gp6-like head-tail connector protein n=1 Tax=Streptomyces sp. CFMR 7 TaxID=1649184 RepID=UPI0021B55BF0|nr:phage gp6-like head-tail connector protein [Streptomyces sp. CFMR 7]